MLGREQITRGNLPHWYVPGTGALFATYRIAGSIPKKLLTELREKKQELMQAPLPKATTVREHRRNIHKTLFADYDRCLDLDAEVKWLADSRIAAMIRRNLYHHDQSKYHLLAYCIMSNHVHVVFEPIDIAPNEPAFDSEEMVGEVNDGLSPLSKIMHSLKSYTANQANAILKRSGQFWQQRVIYDHWVLRC